jgi:hypothetical protein
MAFKKGHPKYGGKAKGSKNYATVERELLIEQALHRRQRLGRDVLEKWMIIFDDRATELMQQQIPVEKQADGSVANVAELIKERDAQVERLSMLSVECATRLAQYQSPKLRATFVQTDINVNKAAEDAEATAELDRIISGVLRGRGVIDVTPVVAKDERGGEEPFTPKLVVPRSR